MNIRVIDEQLRLIPYYPNEEVALLWYQDPLLCKQLDNIDCVYDIQRLRNMYDYLNQNGELYYIEYQGILVGDVTLRDNQEVCIAIAREYQNRHIGRRCIQEMMKLAKEKGYSKVLANVYSFNHQSQKMFQTMGFHQTDKEWFEKELVL